MTGFDLAELRSAFGTYMTGVTVVTAVSDTGAPVGFTANSFTSVSLDPPLLLVCPAVSLGSSAVFARCDRFTVNILAEDQQDVSNIFASFPDDRFAQVAWQPDSAGVPVIDGCAASFSCRTYDRMSAGDHHILVGQIDGFSTSGKAGLGYSNGGYFSIGLERRAAELSGTTRSVRVGVIVERAGRVLLEHGAAGWRPLQIETGSRSGSLSALRDFLHGAGLDVEFGPVYSIVENRRRGEYSVYYRGSTEHSDTRELGTYIDIDEFPSIRFATPAIANLMKRYALERAQGVFYLYVGDEHDGAIHMLGEGGPL